MRQSLAILRNPSQKIMITDTHTHLYAEEFDEDRPALISDAIHQGITRFFMPNIDSTSIGPMLELQQKYPENCFPMMGLHPCSVKENYLEEIRKIEKTLMNGHFSAIGEIGIDLYWDKTFINEQEEVFKLQADWAFQLNMPIAIHTRNSMVIVIDLLEKMKNRPSGIFHCFSATAEDAKRVVGLGFKLGIGGVVTFKNGGLTPVIEAIPLTEIVLETDAPYLAPAPHRGKRNIPSYIIEVLKKVAEIKGTSEIEVADITTKNSKNIFKQ